MSSLRFEKDKPWMTQLALCSLPFIVAKVEETQVPLLLDLQVEETKYVFEAKTIQRMELLVLSTLHWKMNQVTPLSFLDHIIRRLGLKNNLHWEFMKRCERLYMHHFRFEVHFVISLRTCYCNNALHVIKEVEPCNPNRVSNRLMDILKINKDKLDESRCSYLGLDFGDIEENECELHSKRKYRFEPGDPNGVIDRLSAR
ncbi:hypothetical protein IFM89_000127 [Coptis chinensis]|uniref:Cyclin N-terminal domain-containing protein n=1 Tax=Coptis chinensis TaxID=261450 RepID=A0A835LUC7_9MAGN|nr:hypothetical protein IFM89_000127 [Coptis chinensis]